jgi:hypothetical protein
MQRPPTSRVLCLWLLVCAIVSCPALAGRCGDGVLDAGEECDHGQEWNGQTCCDSACRWVTAGIRCMNRAGDPCRQARCDAAHICVVPDGRFIDPCDEDASCRGCVISGQGTSGFSCTGPARPDGSPCADDETPNHRCTTDSCSGGACTHVPKACPDPGKQCMVGACDPDTGACEAKPSTDPACKGKSS